MINLKTYKEHRKYCLIPRIPKEKKLTKKCKDCGQSYKRGLKLDHTTACPKSVTCGKCKANYSPRDSNHDCQSYALQVLGERTVEVNDLRMQVEQMKSSLDMFKQKEQTMIDNNLRVCCSCHIQINQKTDAH